MVHVTITTPLSGMICRRCAGTSYNSSSHLMHVSGKLRGLTFDFLPPCPCLWQTLQNSFSVDLYLNKNLSIFTFMVLFGNLKFKKYCTLLHFMNHDKNMFYFFQVGCTHESGDVINFMTVACSHD